MSLCKHGNILSHCAECTPSTPTKLRAITAYDKVDRFLRNNLGDSDYEDYSAALETVFEFAPIEAQPCAVAGLPEQLTHDVLTALECGCLWTADTEAEGRMRRVCDEFRRWAVASFAAPSAVLPLGEAGTGEGA